MSSDYGDLLLSLSEAMLYPKQAHVFSFELFLVYLQEPASGKLKMTTARVDRTEVLPSLFALTLGTLIASANW